MPFSRRDFVKTSVLGAVAAGVGTRAQGEESKQSAGSQEQDAQTRAPKRPIIVCANNGYAYLEDAFAFLKSGGDTLDAALRVVKGPEDDPNDDSVGLGGIPNEEGVVELDACCMHGPTRRAGSVGGVRNIKNVSLVSKAVMEHTGHVMLVGEGAERFAVAVGFPRENLRARAAGLGIEPELQLAAVRKVLFPPTGTIHCSALNDKGEISGCTTTSGLSFKLPGRVGDSPIIGAGCYTDQDVGSAGATGSGEENIKVAGAHTIVENMRHGMSPQEAGMDALKRIVRNYNGDMNKLRFVDMIYYILRKDGAYAGVSLWEGYSKDRPHKIAIHDGTRRAEVTVSLLKGYSQSFPPFPNVPEDLKKGSEYLK